MLFQRQNLTRTFLFLLIALAALVLALGTVFAHEGREVGNYELVFGWRVEPALVGFPNGPELFIGPDVDNEPDEEDEAIDYDSAPLGDVDVSLQVEVTFGAASRTLDLRPLSDEPAHYIADLIPTRPGDYSFRVFGTIGEQAIDEVFTSAAGEFGSVEPAADVTFPDELPSVMDLLDRIATLEARIEALESGE